MAAFDLVPSTDKRSLLERLVGRRSLFDLIFGSMFADAKTMSGVIALILLLVMGDLYVREAPVPDQLATAAMMVLSFYFGTTRSSG
jgi:hypothetical protein